MGRIQNTRAHMEPSWCCFTTLTLAACKNNTTRHLVNTKNIHQCVSPARRATTWFPPQATAATRRVAMEGNQEEHASLGTGAGPAMAESACTRVGVRSLLAVCTCIVAQRVPDKPCSYNHRTYRPQNAGIPLKEIARLPLLLCFPSFLINVGCNVDSGTTYVPHRKITASSVQRFRLHKKIDQQPRIDMELAETIVHPRLTTRGSMSPFSFGVRTNPLPSLSLVPSTFSSKVVKSPPATAAPSPHRNILPSSATNTVQLNPAVAATILALPPPSAIRMPFSLADPGTAGLDAEKSDDERETTSRGTAHPSACARRARERETSRSRESGMNEGCCC